MVTLQKRTTSYLSVSARIRVIDPLSQMKREYNTILEDADSTNRKSGAPRAKRASGVPWVNKSTHPRKFGNHVTTDRPSAPQAYQCLLSHFLATLGAQEKADCTSMLSSINSCQNRVSADQYHLTVSWAQVSTHQGRIFFEVIR